MLASDRKRYVLPGSRVFEKPGRSIVLGAVPTRSSGGRRGRALCKWVDHFDQNFLIFKCSGERDGKVVDSGVWGPRVCATR
jgi:hypothetical protein